MYVQNKPDIWRRFVIKDDGKKRTYKSVKIWIKECTYEEPYVNYSQDKVIGDILTKVYNNIKP